MTDDHHITTGDDHITTGDVVRQAVAYGLAAPGESFLSNPPDQRPGESRAAWKNRTFAQHYGAGTQELGRADGLREEAETATLDYETATLDYILVYGDAALKKTQERIAAARNETEEAVALTYARADVAFIQRLFHKKDACTCAVCQARKTEDDHD